MNIITYASEKLKGLARLSKAASIDKDLSAKESNDTESVISRNVIEEGQAISDEKTNEEVPRSNRENSI